MKKESVLVSACLMGVPCRYDGRDNVCPRVIALAQRYRLIPICPECDGGLPTPRTPSERRGDRVYMRTGEDVTDAFRRGAEHALSVARAEEVAFAILKSKSPSCGIGTIYDGSFRGALIAGNGLAAELLLKNNVRVLTERDIEEME